jgi:hypothetical protein
MSMTPASSLNPSATDEAKARFLSDPSLLASDLQRFH